MNIALELISTKMRPLLVPTSVVKPTAMTAPSVTGSSTSGTSPVWPLGSGDVIDVEELNVDWSNLKRSKNKMPDGFKGLSLPGGLIQRAVEIPREAVGIIIGQGGKKIKELCIQSGAKIQFRVNKTAEKDGRPGLLEVQGSPEHVESGLQLVWDMLQLVGKEFVEIPPSKAK